MPPLLLYTAEALGLVALSLAIPLVYWFFIARGKEGFLPWLGLRVPKVLSERRFLLLFFGAMLFELLYAFWLRPSLGLLEELPTEAFLGKGAAALPYALVYSVLASGLAEELFFRGFLARRFIEAWGFLRGNLLQSALYGLFHGVLFARQSPPWAFGLVFVFGAVAGWADGHIGERETDGSVLPAWALHSAVSFGISLIALFGH